MSKNVKTHVPEETANARNSPYPPADEPVGGFATSATKHCRQFLACALGLALLWETVARPIIITCWPQIILPPSLLKEISALMLSIAAGGL